MNFGHFAATDGAAGSPWWQGPGLTNWREKGRQNGAAADRLPTPLFKKKVARNTCVNIFSFKPPFLLCMELCARFRQAGVHSTHTSRVLENFCLLFFTPTLSSSFFQGGTPVNCKSLFLSGESNTSFPAGMALGKEYNPWVALATFPTSNTALSAFPFYPTYSLQYSMLNSFCPWTVRKTTINHSKKVEFPFALRCYVYYFLTGFEIQKSQLYKACYINPYNYFQRKLFLWGQQTKEILKQTPAFLMGIYFYTFTFWVVVKHVADNSYVNLHDRNLEISEKAYEES